MTHPVWETRAGVVWVVVVVVVVWWWLVVVVVTKAGYHYHEYYHILHKLYHNLLQLHTLLHTNNALHCTYKQLKHTIFYLLTKP